ncbi:4Fe-4S dicluster domain-containing protein, partial [Salmonella sp. SAL04269]|uniref:4Fe-4S dicluster domain-containing protein n=1 Tax=Salmonella sp. SAL04269 TaxID=3159847 RepID=UPI0039787D14
VCKYMCPYARFQSAMFDRNTLLIAYDPRRGEPRGPRKRGLASVLERGRGLLDLSTAYDYVFRASQHPSAAAARAQAGGTI